jgi:hypothetical protein
MGFCNWQKEVFFNMQVIDLFKKIKFTKENEILLHKKRTVISTGCKSMEL